MRVVLQTVFLVLLAGVIVMPSSRAGRPGIQESAPTAVSYYRGVRPILQRQCSGCHFPGKREGGLSVITLTDLAKGGESGETIQPGDPDSSLLIDYVSGDDPKMPLNADPLKPEEIHAIREWIAQGAVDDTPPSLARPISEDNPPVYSSLPVVTALDYSPDSTWLAVSGYHEVILHHLSGAESPIRLIGRSQRIESVSFSPDGSLLAIAGGTPSLFGELQIWNIAERRLVHSITAAHDTLFGVSFNEDGSLVATGGADNSVRAWNTASGEQTMRMDAHSDWVLGTTFSLKNDHLISVSRDMSMKLTIVANGQFVDNITSITPGALKGGLVDVQRHPSREEVLAVGSDGEPRLYRIFREQDRRIGDDFNLVRAYRKLEGRLSDLDFSPSGDRFICGASTALSGSAQICQTDDAAAVIALEGIASPVFAVAWRPDGQQVAVGGFDGRIQFFRADSGAPDGVLPCVPAQFTTEAAAGAAD